jgi:hypothetical protein
VPRAAENAIAPALAFPTPQEETYQGCPPPGDGGDAQLNLLKNRIDTGRWQVVNLSSLLGLNWPKGVEKTARSAWSGADAAAVARAEGRPVVAEGYLLMLRHEGPESPNCHDRTQRDYHVWLAVFPSDSRAHAMIVELTPRVVARNPGWGTQSAILGLAGKHARISGWLMLDQEHPEQVNRTRATLWEIHPVMRIVVDQGGKWIDLETGKVDTGTTAPVQGTPQPTARATATSTSTKGLKVTVKVSPNPTSDGTPTTVQATTSAGAQCTVSVLYPSGSHSTSGALRTVETADTHGHVSWTWTPSTKSTGTATATVSCTLGNHTATGAATFTVQ